VSESADSLPTASWNTLVQRAQLIRRIRAFFDQRGFVEVETPILSQDTCVDRHLHPIAVPSCGLQTPAAGELPPQLWLQTSPEFGMKRLLAAGAPAIYQITKSFRGGEFGTMHNPEFTMLEWYRVGDDLHAGMELLGQFIAELLPEQVGGVVRKISYQDLFLQHLGVNPFNCSLQFLIEIATAAGFVADRSPGAEDRDFWLNLLLSRSIEPRLTEATIVFDWPPSQSALAIVRSVPFPVAERFELYLGGVELANGYHELLDAEELWKRNCQQNHWRELDGNPLLPNHSRLLSAMRQGLPPCAGVALGVDRLVMLATAAKRIDQVIPFPIDRA
jgi:lysyl-tRNA synthetase class 2